MSNEKPQTFYYPITLSGRFDAQHNFEDDQPDSHKYPCQGDVTFIDAGKEVHGSSKFLVHDGVTWHPLAFGLPTTNTPVTMMVTCLNDQFRNEAYPRFRCLELVFSFLQGRTIEADRRTGVYRLELTERQFCHLNNLGEHFVYQDKHAQAA